MEKYLAIITTVLVLTQIIRLVQNMIHLHRQNKLVNAQLNSIGELTDEDLKTRIENDKMLSKLLPILVEQYACHAHEVDACDSDDTKRMEV